MLLINIALGVDSSDRARLSWRPAQLQRGSKKASQVAAFFAGVERRIFSPKVRAERYLWGLSVAFGCQVGLL